MVFIGLKFCPQDLFKSQGKNWPASEILEQNGWILAQKCSFCIYYLGWFCTPQDLQNRVGIVLMGPKFCTQVPSKIQEKILPCLWNLTDKPFSFSTKKIYFGVITGGGFITPGPPGFGRGCSCGFQIWPTSPLHDTGKEIDLSVKPKSQMVEF